MVNCWQWFCSTWACMALLMLWVVELIFLVFISVMSACLLGGLLLGCEGFTSHHQCSLCLGAGYEQWKL